MSLAGHITIDIVRDKPLQVTLSSSRNTKIAAMLVGKTAQDAIQILPKIFSICGWAHQYAAAQACKGQSDDAAPNQAIAMALAVQCEMAREHILHILKGWAHTVGKTPDKAILSPLMQLPGAMMQAANDSPQAFSFSKKPNAAKPIQTHIDVLRSIIETHILQKPIAEWLAMHTVSDFMNWANQTQTVTGAFIRFLLRQNWETYGAILVQPLPKLPITPLMQRLSLDEDFIRQPNWQGRCYETGPLARCHDSPLIIALSDVFGTGLLVRQAARLYELAILPQSMQEQAQNYFTPGAEKTIQAPYPGLGIVETARGRLIHSVAFQNEHITSYKILAPTEWNFHPHGAVTQCLTALNDNADLQQQARLIVEALDPCVQYEVRVA